MDLYYDILLAATPEGCPEPPRSDFYNEMVDQLCRKALRDIRKIVSEEPSGEWDSLLQIEDIWEGGCHGDCGSCESDCNSNAYPTFAKLLLAVASGKGGTGKSTVTALLARNLASRGLKVAVLDADLAAATKTAVFKKSFPDRHFDCGIAEANMTGIAAGLATCGKVPFISSFAMFAAGRNFEQVRNSIGYPHLNVKIGATHAGISVGEDGATHQCLEDIALMRTIPGMVVINPADDVEARAAVHAAYDHVGPVYLRFGRLPVPVFNDEATYKFEIGKGIVLKEGKDVTIFATGLCVNETVEAEKMLAKDGIDAEIINIHTIKPIDRELVVKSALKTGKVVTVEEHSVIGGLGSAVCDVLCEEAPTKVLKIGVNDVFGESGPALELLHKYELDAEGIYKKVKAFVK